MSADKIFDNLAGVPGYDCRGTEIPDRGLQAQQAVTYAETPIDTYLRRHKALCDEARQLSNRKNHDYADPGRSLQDPYAVYKNFLQVERLGICTTEQGFLTRLSDKFTRLANLLATGHEAAVKDESVKDTILDIVNYVILLQTYLEVKARQNRAERTSC